MKYVVIAARVLLGALFVFAGSNGLLHFIKPEPMPPSDAATWATILMTHSYMTFVSVLMLIAGLLILVGRFVPLGLTILAPIIVNILLFHFSLAHGGAGAGIFAAVLEIFLIAIYRESFIHLFHPDPLANKI